MLGYLSGVMGVWMLIFNFWPKKTQKHKKRTGKRGAIGSERDLGVRSREARQRAQNGRWIPEGFDACPFG